jgi:glycosyltransferase involved in cell wall biosynthesis
MKKKCVVSVIIPTYNRVEKLKRAIDSVINQTFSDWEIIIIDNHSKDGTKELINEYNSSKIKILFIKNRGNIAKSRNLGIKKSRGKYLALLDSDDIWNSSKLQICVKALNDKTRIVYHDMYIQNNINQTMLKKSGMCRKLKKPIFNDLILNGPAFPTSSVVIEKKLFKKIHFFNENPNFITWEDYEAWIRLSKISNGFKKVDLTLGSRWSDNENTLNPRRLIKNIFLFKKYILFNKEFPNWCKLGLMKSYYYTNQSIKLLKIISMIDFKSTNFIDKIKILTFFILVKLKIFFN